MKQNRIEQKHSLFVKLGIIVVAGMTLFFIGCGKTVEKPLIVQEPLPFKMDALKPYISEKTMEFHYGKHYTGYVKKANQLLNEKEFEGKTATEIIRFTADKEKYSTIFNNVAQAWNHAFFWKCLTPNGGISPEGDLAKRIKESFGSFDAFKKKFVSAATGQFGSGWAWLVFDGKKLAIMTTGNGDTPLAHGLTPVFTVDVWEHAYYLDYQNKRSEYVNNILDHIANWNFSASRLKLIEG